MTHNVVETDTEVSILLDQKVSMSDGTNLSLTLFRSEHQSKPLPTVFSFSPYTLKKGYDDGMWFARRGYNYVRGDMRGRGNSDGVFEPFKDCGQDGAELVAWIARQPWSDGQVAMFGVSYEGLTPWQVLGKRPPALRTIVSLAAAYPCADTVLPLAYMVQWLALVSGRLLQEELFLDFSYWHAKYYRRYIQHLPWAQLAQSTHTGVRTWAEWVEHPHQDAYWDAMVPTAAEFAQIRTPTLTITSYYDLAQKSALRAFRSLLDRLPETEKPRHHVVLGPWSHGGVKEPARALGGLDFGEASVLYKNVKELAIQWFDSVMKGDARPDRLKKQITYYAMEENVWKHAGDLESLSDSAITWYLAGKGGTANDVFHSGALQIQPPAGHQEPDQFVNDPLKLMSEGEYFASAPNILDPNWLTDGSSAFERDILIYHSPPLEETIDVAGRPSLRVFLELNVPDTDLYARLFEVRPNGTVIWLSEARLRARYRASYTEPRLVDPGTVQLYEFADFLILVRRIPKASRLRLILSGLNHPNYQKNYNSGGEVARETSEQARIAIVRVHHDPSHPSALELPIASTACRQTKPAQLLP
jgi:uncharacterized protein